MIFAFLASWIAMCASVATFRAMERRDDRHASQAAPYAPPALACPLPSTCSMVRAMLAEGASLLGGMM